MVPSTWVMWIMPSANLLQRCDNTEPLGRSKEERKGRVVAVEGCFCLREI